MKLGDLVMLSKKAQKQHQNRHIAWDDVGFVTRNASDNLLYVKWFKRLGETMHYRYELKRAK